METSSTIHVAFAEQPANLRTAKFTSAPERVAPVKRVHLTDGQYGDLVADFTEPRHWIRKINTRVAGATGVIEIRARGRMTLYVIPGAAGNAERVGIKA